MDIFTLQALEDAKNDPTVITGGQFGTDAYGKHAMLTTFGSYGWLGYSTSSFNNTTYFTYWLAANMGALYPASTTIGANHTKTNAYAGFKAFQPPEYRYINKNVRQTSNVVSAKPFSDSTNSNYRVKPISWFAIKNNNAADVQKTIQFVGSAYNTQTQMFVYSMVPNNADKSAVTDVDLTFHYTSSTNASHNSSNQAITLKGGGATTVFGVCSSQRYVYAQHQNGYVMVNGAYGAHVLADDPDLETDWDMLKSIENRACLPYTGSVTVGAVRQQMATMWPLSVSDKLTDLKTEVG